MSTLNCLHVHIIHIYIYGKATKIIRWTWTFCAWKSMWLPFRTKFCCLLITKKDIRRRSRQTTREAYQIHRTQSLLYPSLLYWTSCLLIRGIYIYIYMEPSCLFFTTGIKVNRRCSIKLTVPTTIIYVTRKFPFSLVARW
jgi:hypothetical protein